MPSGITPEGILFCNTEKEKPPEGGFADS